MKARIVHILIAGAFWFALAILSRTTDAASANAGFDGTWVATFRGMAPEGGYTVAASFTMTISRSHATLLDSSSYTLDTPEDDWSFLPLEFQHASPLIYTVRRESTAVKSSTAMMQITWGMARLVDWSPRGIPGHYLEAQAGRGWTASYVMRGDTLFDPRNDRTWHRISTSQRAAKQTTATSGPSRRATKQTTATTSTGVGGTWRGTINFGIGGTWNLQLQVAPDGSSVTESGGLAKLTHAATRSANGIVWRSGVFNELEWTLTPQSGGRTAIVTAKSPLGVNDTAVFQR